MSVNLERIQMKDGVKSYTRKNNHGPIPISGKYAQLHS